jgi:hypothetical protein
MKLMLRFAPAVLSLGFAMAASAAQSQSPAAVDYADTALVSAEQGQALADFAMQSGPRVRPKPDCSHLVHLLYARAGLIYPYEDSRVLYRGVDDFERVKTPQPGDLAVWLGHVGIVLSPEDKTFLSSVRSGIITESWTAPHWARRGHPHFFRYRIGPSANLELLAAIMSDGPAVSNPSVRDRNPAVRSEDTQIAGVQNQDFPNETARNEASRNDVTRNSDIDIQDADGPGEDSRAPRTHRDVPLPRQGRRDEDRPDKDRRDEDRRDTAAESAAGGSAAFVAVIHQRKTPGKREIVAAIIDSGNARARELTAGRTLDLDHPVSVFDRVEVTRIKMKHESGSVAVRLSETMSQEAGRIFAARMIEREFSMVRRRDGVWIISDPRRRTYVPQAQALGVFESQAEIFLRRAPNSSGTRALVKALDRLYDQLPGPQQRAAR